MFIYIYTYIYIYIMFVFVSQLMKRASHRRLCNAVNRKYFGLLTFHHFMGHSVSRILPLIGHFCSGNVNGDASNSLDDDVLRCISC